MSIREVNRKFFFVGLTASFAQMRRLAIVMASNNSRQIFCKDLPKVIQFLRSFFALFCKCDISFVILCNMCYFGMKKNI